MNKETIEVILERIDLWSNTKAQGFGIVGVRENGEQTLPVGIAGEEESLLRENKDC